MIVTRSNKNIYILSCLCLLIALAACHKQRNLINRIDLNSEFRFDIVEHYSGLSGERIPYLKTLMFKEILCDKARFDTSLEISHDSILFNIYSISTQENCGDTASFPVTYVPLKQLELKEYVLEIHIRDIFTIHGTLLNQKDRLILKIPTQYGMEIFERKLYKVPEKAVWGRLSIDDNQYLNIINKFTEDIAEKVGKLKLQDGYYTPFIIFNGHVSLNASEYPPMTPFHKAFLLKVDNQSEISFLKTRVDSFRQAYRGKIYLDVFTWEDKEL